MSIWILTLNSLDFLSFLFLALLSHVSSNKSMMSLSTRRVRTGGMIFSLFFACGLIPNYLKYSWRGVSTIRASISCWMAMCTSTSLHCSNSIKLGFLLVCWRELSMLQEKSKTLPAKWTYGPLRVYTMNDVLGYGCKRPLRTFYLLIA